jgi:UDPglucose 6-dehydrogenase
MKIGIVGHGFVGQAVDYGFSHTEKIISDPKYTQHGDGSTRYYNSISSAILNSVIKPEFIFICVPTPMGENGKIDDRIIRQVLYDIEKWSSDSIVILKSTITPFVLEELVRDFNKLHLVYNPEFLTERSAKDDFVNPQFHVIGAGSKWLQDSVENLYLKHSLCRKCPVHKMGFLEAGYVKYGINTFLATKITFMNQMKDVVDEKGLDFQTVINTICSDSRIGYSHSRVPGFDGKPGYGGACFPKDVSALIRSEHIPLLEKVHELNVEYRKDLELDEREKEQNVHYE